jgi:voltage-gated potassium channel
MQNRRPIRRLIYDVLHGREASRGSRAFARALTTLILLNALAVILESVPQLSERWWQLFWGFELFSVTVFALPLEIQPELRVPANDAD